MTNPPTPGDLYAFKYTLHGADDILPLLVHDVTDTHVYYSFPDTDINRERKTIYLMLFDVWRGSAWNRAYVGNVSNNNERIEK